MPTAKRRLSDEVVAARMVEWRNLKQAHARDQEQIAALKAENEELKRLLNQALEQIKTQAIRIAELEAMVFGKKKRPPMGVPPIGADEQVAPISSAPPKQPRSKDSYRRPVPPASAITSEVAMPLPDTCACGGSFDTSSITLHDRYEEDIPLPELTPDYQAHLVVKYVISRGICLTCGKATVGGGRDLGGAQVSLGPNVRLLVTHLISGVGMSYSQTSSLLLSLYSLVITDGEIVNILHKQHEAWLPAYAQLKADIRAAPVVHGDETPWPIQDLQGGGYAWCMSDAESPKVCFALEQSRGAVHARSLFGQDTDHPFVGIRITDDYAAYRSETLPGSQQLCWAHLYRAIRDLRYNANLPEEQLAYVTEWYASFAGIYQDLRQYLDKPYDESLRDTQANELWNQIQLLANQPAPDHGEPDKLARLKAQLLRAGKDRLLICLPKNTPCDNNRAERDLRQLVLKRKRSFGSKTLKGATALATILSLCTTTWRTTKPANYFSALASLAG
jgi:transposase